MASGDDKRERLQRALVDLAERMLVELFNRHGVPARADGHSIHVDSAGLWVECGVANLAQHPNAVVLQLDVRMWTSLVPEHPIHTPLAGFGDSWPVAVHKALTDWFHRIFEPVQAALGFRPDEPAHRLLVTGTATGEATTWDVFEGPIEVVAQGADKQPILDQIVGEQRPFPLILDTMTRVVGADPRRPLHWVKLFLARNHDGSRVTECQIDNVDWSDGLEKLLAFRWPDQPGYLAVKYFAVLRRTRPHPSQQD